MSELINRPNSERNFRVRMLASASGLALLAAICRASSAMAADQNRPTVWIELGGQLSELSDSEDAFLPAFTSTYRPNGINLPTRVELPSRYGLETTGSILFEPDGGNWIFTASVRYGRSNKSGSSHQQTPNAKIPLKPFTFYGKYFVGHSYYPTGHLKFADASAKRDQTHAVLDFAAGKDVGLGMFGNEASSILTAGVRIAQFTSKAKINLHAEPDVRYPTAPITNEAEKYMFQNSNQIRFHDYAASAELERSFQGVGPSIGWNASVPIAGNADAGGLSFDWGVNGAVLFGRQKASGHHQTTKRSYDGKTWVGGRSNLPTLHKGNFFGGQSAYPPVPPTQSHHGSANFDRVRSVIVPNLGGFGGISYHLGSAKVSLGYRADFFFGAMDGGIDTAKNENVGFYGPFASVSVGLGG